MRIREDNRGNSVVIATVLGLIIVVTIVVNIFLWNYDMNQLDYEKIREDVTIASVVRTNSSSIWFVTQSEYKVNKGIQVNGSYLDTQNVDSNYEGFRERSVASNTTLINAESFEGTWPPTGWTETGQWNKESQQAFAGTFSADFDSIGITSGDLTTHDMDCSDANAIYVEFWYRDDNLDTDDLLLRYYDGSTWDTISDLGFTTQEDQWLHYQHKITDSQYFVSNFKIQWSAVSVTTSENAWVDYVNIKKEILTNQLDLNGTFNLDMSTYSSSSIQNVEIQLRYLASDTSERWFLKAYNWTSGAYSDSGFNSTVGHTPTTGWDYYAVNLTNQWNSYLHSNGTIYVKIVDEGADDNQTTIEVDFLAVRVEAEGSQFTFYNEGSFTCHLVSLWVNNSTHHNRYDIDLYVNVAHTQTYERMDISLPANYIVKVITERGNIAVYSEN